MPLYEIYSHPYRKIYKASLCSKATLFQIITFVLTIICPLLIAYRSQGFWMKINTYREQPSIRFKYDYLFYLQGSNPDSYLIWTSCPGLAQLEDSHLRVPILRVYETDQDRDGKFDYLQMQINFPINLDERVEEVIFMLIFDYRLELHSRFQMQTMIYGKYVSTNGAVALNVDGDMRIMQKIPLRYRGIDTRYDTPIINRSSLDANNFRFSNILQKYQSRNISTKFESVVSSWLPGPVNVAGEFRLNIKINYASDTFEYWTGFWELIKWAWIQYLSILLIFLFVMKRVKEYVFRNRLVTSVPVQDQHLITGSDLMIMLWRVL